MADTTVLDLEYKVAAPLYWQDGTVISQPYAGRYGSALVSPLLPAYAELCLRGLIYCAENQAEVTFGTALTATAVTYTLYNPIGSTVDLVLLHVATTIRTCSTPGHLTIAANTNPNAAAPATNTELVVKNARLDKSAGIAKVYSVTTLPAIPLAIRSLGVTLTAAGIGLVESDIQGAIVLGPNTAVTVQGITVVGTGLISMFWAEMPRAV